MEYFKKKVQDSAHFYNESFSNFDYKLTEMNYLSLKPFFKGALALELGPALGQMTKYLVHDFKEIHMVEGSKTLLDQIPNYPNVVKYHSYFEEFKTNLKFDTILLSHVLEHIENPIELLKQIYGWLSDDGVFLVSVPNAKSIHRLVAVEMGLLKSEFDLNERDHELGHYRVYDLSTLKNDVQAAGFNIISEGGIFFKPISNAQIEKNWSKEMVEGFFKVGDKFPNLCAEIYVILKK
jgi:2-polyprenyl-3-methyl-5-hydroxy-6-metoxy-1,4-benzoquinol methylase